MENKYDRWDYDIPGWLRIDIQKESFRKTNFGRRARPISKKITMYQVICKMTEHRYSISEITEMTELPSSSIRGYVRKKRGKQNAKRKN
jgi:hypothetical protein